MEFRFFSRLAVPHFMIVSVLRNLFGKILDVVMIQGYGHGTHKRLNLLVKMRRISLNLRGQTFMSLLTIKRELLYDCCCLCFLFLFFRFITCNCSMDVILYSFSDLCHHATIIPFSPLAALQWQPQYHSHPFHSHSFHCLGVDRL